MNLKLFTTRIVVVIIVLSMLCDSKLAFSIEILTKGKTLGTNSLVTDPKKFKKLKPERVTLVREEKGNPVSSYWYLCNLGIEDIPNVYIKETDIGKFQSKEISLSEPSMESQWYKDGLSPLASLEQYRKYEFMNVQMEEKSDEAVPNQEVAAGAPTGTYPISSGGGWTAPKSDGDWSAPKIMPYETPKSDGNFTLPSSTEEERAANEAKKVAAEAERKEKAASDAYDNIMKSGVEGSSESDLKNFVSSLKNVAGEAPAGTTKEKLSKIIPLLEEFIGKLNEENKTLEREQKNMEELLARAPGKNTVRLRSWNLLQGGYTISSSLTSMEGEWKPIKINNLNFEIFANSHVSPECLKGKSIAVPSEYNLSFELVCLNPEGSITMPTTKGKVVINRFHISFTPDGRVNTYNRTNFGASRYYYYDATLLEDRSCKEIAKSAGENKTGIAAALTGGAGMSNFTPRPIVSPMPKYQEDIIKKTTDAQQKIDEIKEIVRRAEEDIMAAAKGYWEMGGYADKDVKQIRIYSRDITMNAPKSELEKRVKLAEKEAEDIYDMVRGATHVENYCFEDKKFTDGEKYIGAIKGNVDRLLSQQDLVGAFREATVLQEHARSVEKCRDGMVKDRERTAALLVIARDTAAKGDPHFNSKEPPRKMAREAEAAIYGILGRVVPIVMQTDNDINQIKNYAQRAFVDAPNAAAAKRAIAAKDEVLKFTKDNSMPVNCYGKGKTSGRVFFKSENDMRNSITIAEKSVKDSVKVMENLLTRSDFQGAMREAESLKEYSEDLAMCEQKIKQDAATIAGLKQSAEVAAMEAAAKKQKGGLAAAIQGGNGISNLVGVPIVGGPAVSPLPMPSQEELEKAKTKTKREITGGPVVSPIMEAVTSSPAESDTKKDEGEKKVPKEESDQKIQQDKEKLLAILPKNLKVMCDEHGTLATGVPFRIAPTKAGRTQLMTINTQKYNKRELEAGIHIYYQDNAVVPHSIYDVFYTLTYSRVESALRTVERTIPVPGQAGVKQIFVQVYKYKVYDATNPQISREGTETKKGVADVQVRKDGAELAQPVKEIKEIASTASTVSTPRIVPFVTPKITPPAVDLLAEKKKREDAERKAAIEKAEADAKAAKETEKRATLIRKAEDAAAIVKSANEQVNQYSKQSEEDLKEINKEVKSLDVLPPSSIHVQNAKSASGSGAYWAMITANSVAHHYKTYHRKSELFVSEVNKLIGDRKISEANKYASELEKYASDVKYYADVIKEDAIKVATFKKTFQDSLAQAKSEAEEKAKREAARKKAEEEYNVKLKKIGEAIKALEEPILATEGAIKEVIKYKSEAEAKKIGVEEFMKNMIALAENVTSKGEIVSTKAMEAEQLLNGLPVRGDNIEIQRDTMTQFANAFSTPLWTRIYINYFDPAANFDRIIKASKIFAKNNKDYALRVKTEMLTKLDSKIADVMREFEPLLRQNKDESSAVGEIVKEAQSELIQEDEMIGDEKVDGALSEANRWVRIVLEKAHEAKDYSLEFETSRAASLVAKIYKAISMKNGDEAKDLLQEFKTLMEDYKRKNVRGSMEDALRMARDESDKAVAAMRKFADKKALEKMEARMVARREAAKAEKQAREDLTKVSELSQQSSGGLLQVFSGSVSGVSDKKVKAMQLQGDAVALSRKANTVSTSKEAEAILLEAQKIVEASKKNVTGAGSAAAPAPKVSGKDKGDVLTDERIPESLEVWSRVDLGKEVLLPPADIKLKNSIMIKEKIFDVAHTRDGKTIYLKGNTNLPSQKYVLTYELVKESVSKEASDIGLFKSEEYFIYKATLKSKVLKQ